jgi:hypothetical protein
MRPPFFIYSTHFRASENPALGLRFRGDEREQNHSAALRAYGALAPSMEKSRPALPLPPPPISITQ